jgi:hypothetical protein
MKGDDVAAFETAIAETSRAALTGVDAFFGLITLLNLLRIA